MPRSFARIFLFAIAAMSFTSSALADETKELAADRAAPSVHDLAMFLGKWKYVDQSTELAGFDYREDGVLECEYALDQTYIKCEGAGTTNGKSRRFVEFLSYNSLSGHYEKVALFGNFPEKAIFRLKLSNDGRSIQLFGEPMRQRDGSASRNWSVITFKSPNMFEWEVRLNRTGEAPDHWPLKFISVFEKIEQ